MQTTNSNIILDIQNLSCGYGGNPVVENFNLQVSKGECIAITGPNGCGKSTLIRAIYQLCIINSGTISYNGHLLNGKTPEQVKKMGIAYFMQRNAVFSKLSIRDNLLLSLNGTSKTGKRDKIEKLATLLPDIAKWQYKTAGLLSGGQRQQLAMAMLLAQNADLWLLDEPTAGLDKEKTDSFVQTIQNIKKEQSITLLFVEHKTEVVNKLASQTVKFKIT